MVSEVKSPLSINQDREMEKKFYFADRKINMLPIIISCFILTSILSKRALSAAQTVVSGFITEMSVLSYLSEKEMMKAA